MTDSYDQKFDHLIKELTKDLTRSYIENLSKRTEFQHNDIDTSPLLNMTLSVFMSSIIHILDIIKSQTVGEVKLIQNIELARKSLTKAISDLPFIQYVEEMK